MITTHRRKYGRYNVYVRIDDSKLGGLSDDPRVDVSFARYGATRCKTEVVVPLQHGSGYGIDSPRKIDEAVRRAVAKCWPTGGR